VLAGSAASTTGVPIASHRHLSEVLHPPLSSTTLSFDFS
jgi:hypothetical protein